MADLLINPQITLPFRVAGGTVVQHEQDSFEDVTQNAVVVMRYTKGDRAADPEFGIPDLTFHMGPVDERALATVIQNYEPGVTADIVQRVLGTGELDVYVDLGRKADND